MCTGTTLCEEGERMVISGVFCVLIPVVRVVETACSGHIMYYRVTVISVRNIVGFLLLTAPS